MKKRVKTYCIIAAILLVLFSGVGGTTAYLTGMFGLTNTFVQGEVTPAVAEEFDGTVKKNVRIENKGNTPVYIRCRVSIYRELPDQSIAVDRPQAGTDYELSFPAGLEDDWLLIDGVYYCKKPVEARAKTANLIERCELKQAGLVVDVSAQAIQADPPAAVQEAWSAVKVGSDGCLQRAKASAAAQRTRP